MCSFFGPRTGPRGCLLRLLFFGGFNGKLKESHPCCSSESPFLTQPPFCFGAVNWATSGKPPNRSQHHVQRLQRAEAERCQLRPQLLPGLIEKQSRVCQWESWFISLANPACAKILRHSGSTVRQSISQPGSRRRKLVS